MAYTTIDDPSAHFQIALYTGNQTGRSITYDGNSDMQPDWLWGKSRSNSDAPTAIDSSRGVGNVLTPSANEAEGTGQSQYVTSFNSDGFGLGTNGGMNRNDYTYVSWGWKANGGTTASNTSGTNITSTVQANTTAGFSIVTWTGTGTISDTVGHGLGVKPDVVLAKERGGADWWHMRHESLGSTENLFLNDTLASRNATGGDYGGNIDGLTSSVFGFSTNSGGNAVSVNDNTVTNVAYCFTPIQGYSKFGSYTGNGSEEGPFVYTGFKPQWIMFKNTGAAEEWVLQDTTRNPNNPVTKNIRVDSNIAEADASNIDFDFLSNGFKNRSNQAQVNSNGVNYIYMAFAEHPFVSSKGIPTTAR